MAKKYTPSTAPMSYTLAMLGWSSEAVTRASFRNSFTNVSLLAYWGRIRFSTTYLAKPSMPRDCAR